MGGEKGKHKKSAERLKRALDLKGWNSQRLSDETGIPKSSISQYRNGYHCPNNLNAGLIGKALGVSPAWLMGFDVDMSVKVGEETFLIEFKQLNADNQTLVREMIHLLSDKQKGGANEDL